MKFKTILPILTLLVALVGCNKPAGELVGAGKAKNFSEADPFGMLLIRKGSFMKGENTQSNLFTMPDNKIMSTVDAFWMDETEITNNEYKQFVFWVRDSIAMTLLVRAGAADEYADGLQFMVTPKEEFIEEIIPDTALNWAMTSKIPWNKYKTDEEVHAALRPLFYSDHTFNTNRMHYHYSWKNYDQAKLQQNKFDVAKGKYPDNARARVDSFWVDENGVIFDTTIIRKLVEPKDLYTECIINIYPDTMVWIRDFQYAYNDPKMLKYFSHEGYANYPVVGVTWEQAHASATGVPRLCRIILHLRLKYTACLPKASGSMLLEVAERWLLIPGAVTMCATTKDASWLTSSRITAHTTTIPATDRWRSLHTDPTTSDCSICQVMSPSGQWSHIPRLPAQSSTTTTLTTHTWRARTTLTS